MKNFKTLMATIASTLLVLVRSNAEDFTYTNNNGAIIYTGTGGNVTIPSTIAGLPVTSIGGVAFQFRMDLTGITIPDSVTNIEDGVLSKFGGFGTFAACTGLTNVVIGKGVMHIGLGAFRACSGLTNVAIPESVISIGDWAFIFCSGLSKVTIGKSVTNIGNDLGNVFAACTNLVGVYFQGNEPLFTSNPPFASPSSFPEDDKATVYYLPNATGWGPTVEGRPAVLWNPQAQTNDGNFGVKQNRFGFNVAGTPDIPLVIEASTNLAAQSWAPLQSCTLTNGLIYFSDAQWTTYPNRVYRIRSP
jgi:hypothetical protein